MKIDGAVYIAEPEAPAGPAVSVLIPVCNGGEYLRQCIDSVLSQKLRDIEVICVDDGSTDSSPAILDGYAAKDTRFKVLHQANAGAGAARNAALDVARGRWLAFLDADDVFDANMLLDMYNVGEEKRADVVACTLVSKGDIFKRWRGWAWDKLFRRDFILREGLRFQNLPVSNDLFFTYCALAKASVLTAVERDYVYHRKRAGSIETTRDKAPLAPLEAVRALYAAIGPVDGFARWVPDFLFWHVNRLKSREASALLYRESVKFGKELGIRLSPKWIYEESKHAVKLLLRGRGAPS